MNSKNQNPGRQPREMGKSLGREHQKIQLCCIYLEHSTFHLNALIPHIALNVYLIRYAIGRDPILVYENNCKVNLVTHYEPSVSGRVMLLQPLRLLWDPN